MRGLVLVVMLGVPSLVLAQNPVSESARQALIEMFFGTAPNHLERHLPEVTKKSFSRMNSSESQNLLAGLSSLSGQIQSSGAKVETFDTGPIILSADDKSPAHSHLLEITVERDDLIGDEDEIELALHLPEDLREAALPITPHVTFTMKSERDVWRLTDITIMLKFPLGDPEFLKSIEDSQRKKAEQMTAAALLRIVAAEEAYHSRRGTYACSLAALAGTDKSQPESGGFLFDPGLATGKEGGYIFAISGCDGSHYKAVAEPAIGDSGRRAFCTDEHGAMLASADGKATTCLVRGEHLDPSVYPQFRLGSTD